MPSFCSTCRLVLWLSGSNQFWPVSVHSDSAHLTGVNVNYVRPWAAACYFFKKIWTVCAHYSGLTWVQTHTIPADLYTAQCSSNWFRRLLTDLQSVCCHNFTLTSLLKFIEIMFLNTKISKTFMRYYKNAVDQFHIIYTSDTTCCSRQITVWNIYI